MTGKSRGRNAMPAPLSEVLDQVLKTAGVHAAVKERLVLAQWVKIAGDAFASHAEAVKIENGVLFLRAENSAWRSQLHFFKGDLIKNINRFAEKKIVKNVCFVS